MQHEFQLLYDNERPHDQHSGAYILEYGEHSPNAVFVCRGLKGANNDFGDLLCVSIAGYIPVTIYTGDNTNGDYRKGLPMKCLSNPECRTQALFPPAFELIELM